MGKPGRVEEKGIETITTFGTPSIMSRRALRPRADVCHLCEFMTGRQSRLYSLVRQSLRKSTPSSRTFSTSRTLLQKSQNPQTTAAKVSSASIGKAGELTDAQLEKRLQYVKAACNTLLLQKNIPTENETLLVLDQQNPNKKDGAASALLSLDETNVKKIPVHKLPPTLQRLVEQLSSLAYSIVKFPPVFI